MDITQLRTFIHVAELGSLNKAAARLRIAQPALSRQIRLLEEDLGTRLFDRHGRGMILTEAGRDALVYAERVVADLDEMKASVNGNDAKLSGHVAIGLPPTVADVVSVPMVAAFRREQPGVMVQIVAAYSGYLLDLLHHGEIDLAVLYDPRAARSLRSEPLMLEPLMLVGPATANLRRDQPVSFKDIAPLPLLLPSGRHGQRALIERFAAEAGISLNVIVEADSYTALKDLVRHGIGHTVMPYSPIREDVTAGRLSVASLVDPTPLRQLVLCFPTDRTVSRVAQYAGEVLVAAIAENAARDGDIRPTTA